MREEDRSVNQENNKRGSCVVNEVDDYDHSKLHPETRNTISHMTCLWRPDVEGLLIRATLKYKKELEATGSSKVPVCHLMIYMDLLCSTVSYVGQFGGIT